jgi:hypothetical protein
MSIEKGVPARRPRRIRRVSSARDGQSSVLSSARRDAESSRKTMFVQTVRAFPRARSHHPLSAEHALAGPIACRGRRDRRDPRSADSTRARNTLPTGLVRTGQLLAEIAPYDGSNLSSSAHLGEMRTHPAPISVATARRWRNRASRAAAAFGNAFTILGQAGASTSRRHARVLLARSRRWLAHRQAIDVNPVREIFERPFPAIDAETMFDVYHPRAKRTLRAAMIPQSIQSIHFAWRLEPRKR